MTSPFARVHASISVNPAQISVSTKSAAERAQFVRGQHPTDGLFADMDWRISPAPFALGADLASNWKRSGACCCSSTAR